MQVALEAQEDFYRLMARGKLGQTGFRQWLRTSAYSIQQVTCTAQQLAFRVPVYKPQTLNTERKSVLAKFCFQHG